MNNRKIENYIYKFTVIRAYHALVFVRGRRAGAIGDTGIILDCEIHLSYT